MIRYNYLSQLQPPAPFIYITLSNPITSDQEQNIPAQLDSAADRTVLPESVARALGLPQIGKLQIGGLGGITQELPTHVVQVRIHNLKSHLVEAVSSPGEQWVLLGRDFLNHHRILLDGPELIIEIS